MFYHSSIRFPPYPDYKIAVFPFFSVSKLRELGIDIVHSHALATMGIAAIVAAKKLKIPCIETFHTKVSEGTHYITSNKQLQEIGEDVVWKYIKWYASQFDTVTCPSEYAKNILELHGVKSEVYPNGVDINLFKPVSMMIKERKLKEQHKAKYYKEKFSINNNTLISVSRLVKEKNIMLAIKAMPYIVKEVKNARLIIGGTGPGRKEFEELAKQTGVNKNVFFAGFIPHHDLPAVYSMVKVFMFPSDFETHGLTGLEALACGVPVVGLKNSAVAEMINPDTGELALNDPESFAKQVVKTLKNHEQYKGTRAYAIQFSNEKITEQFLMLYRRLVNQRI